MSAATNQLDQIKAEVQRLEAENDRLRRDGNRSLYIYADGRIENKPTIEHLGPYLYTEEFNFPFEAMKQGDPGSTFNHYRRGFHFIAKIGDLRVYGEMA